MNDSLASETAAALFLPNVARYFLLLTELQTFQKIDLQQT